MLKQTILKVAGLPVAAALVLTLGGCLDDSYTARRDSVTRAFGDANATNQATQTIDPWSPAAKNSRIETNGKRAAASVRRYETGKVIQPQGLSTSSVTEQAAPAAQSDTAVQK
jgi:hypothetical protein